MEKLFTVLKPEQYEVTIHRSRFIGHINPIDTLDKAKETINSISMKYRDSTHTCWAYAIGLQDVISHSSDAGEPSGTAGRPILGVIQHNKLTNIVITVTRYYGGIQLGIRGLIDAYSQTAEQTVQKAKLQPSVMKDFYNIDLSYKRLEKLKGYLRDKDAEIIDIKYGKEISLKLCIKTGYDFNEYLEAEKSTGELSYEFLKSDIFL